MSQTKYENYESRNLFIFNLHTNNNQCKSMKSWVVTVVINNPRLQFFKPYFHKPQAKRASLD